MLSMHTRQSAVWRWPVLFLIAMLSSSCLDYSPYSIETDEREGTARNIEWLSENSSTTFSPFSFAVLSDSHADYDALLDAVASINQRSDVSFVLHAGDLTDNGLLQEYDWTEDILQRLHVPYLTVIGNHDALNNGKENYQAIYGPYDYSLVFNQVKFVALNSNNWEFDDQVPRVDWLSEAVADYAIYQHQIVLTHIEAHDGRFSGALSAQLLASLKENFVSLVISGHRHEYSYKEEWLTSGQPIGFLINGAVNRHSYAVVHVEAGSVSHERIGF